MAICTFCSQEMLTAKSCAVGVMHRGGVPCPLPPWGAETHWGFRSVARTRCGDCNVVPGGFHHLGCDIAECPHCGGQLISCGCRYDEDPQEEDEDDDEWVA